MDCYFSSTLFIIPYECPSERSAVQYSRGVMKSGVVSVEMGERRWLRRSWGALAAAPPTASRLPSTASPAAVLRDSTSTSLKCLSFRTYLLSYCHLSLGSRPTTHPVMYVIRDSLASLTHSPTTTYSSRRSTEGNTRRFPGSNWKLGLFPVNWPKGRVLVCVAPLAATVSALSMSESLFSLTRSSLQSKKTIKKSYYV